MAIAEIPSPYLEHSHDDGVVSPLLVTRPMSGNRFHQKLQLESNWATLDDQPLTNDNIAALFSNIIPTVRHIKLLSSEECARLVRIIEETEVVSHSSYNARTWSIKALRHPPGPMVDGTREFGSNPHRLTMKPRHGPLCSWLRALVQFGSTYCSCFADCRAVANLQPKSYIPTR